MSNSQNVCDSYPLISIITVCRNSGYKLVETLKNIRKQTYKNIEVIVIDGASIDDTLDCIKRNSSLIDKWISEPDKGIYDAMNKGLRMAKGEWINFMNVGDSFSDVDILTSLFCRYTIFDRIMMIGGGTNNVSVKGSWYDPPKPASVIPYEIPFSHQASFIRRGNWSYNTNYRIASDYKLMYDFYFKYGEESFLIIDKPIADYQKDDSFSTINHKLAKKEYLSIQAKHPSLRWLKECLRYIKAK